MQSDTDNYTTLLFNSSVDFNGLFSGKVTLVNDTTTCLRRTTVENYDFIAILFDHRNLKEQNAYIELCSILKGNQATSHIPILALLPSIHRKLLAQLQDIGIEYVRFYDSGNLNSKHHVETLLAKPSEECKIDRILSDICPHINYFRTNGNQEILYCGAYRNRMVLGSCRLSHFCESSNHTQCRHFNCPRFI